MDLVGQRIEPTHNLFLYIIAKIQFSFCNIEEICLIPRTGGSDGFLDEMWRDRWDRSSSPYHHRPSSMVLTER